MRNAIFKKAVKLVKKVNHYGNSDREEYYKIPFDDDEILISVEVNQFGTEIRCTCKHCSVYTWKYLCSFKLAVILYKCAKHK